MKKLSNLFILVSFFFGCYHSQEKNSIQLESENHVFNELTKTDNRVLTKSNYNTDNPNISKINSISKSIIHSNLDTSQLFQIWCQSQDDPHATFHISSRDFYIVDFDGDGSLKYQ